MEINQIAINRRRNKKQLIHGIQSISYKNR